MAASFGRGNAEEEISAIQKEYETLVDRKRSLLLENGYPIDYCDIKYHCEKCSDTGYVGIDLCSCLRREINQAFMEDCGLYSLLDTETFETFSLSYYQGDDRVRMQRNLEILTKFTEEFVPGSSDSFLFVGGTGLGKTHLSSAVAKRILEKGGYVVYESAIQLLADYETQRFGARAGRPGDVDPERYEECDLLIVDDLGCEVANTFTVSCLYSLINERILRHRSTIINTNLDQEGIRKRYGDRIASRIFGEYRPLLFLGSDVRGQKIKRNIQL
jgi:DNA replication protein DnaC